MYPHPLKLKLCDKNKIVNIVKHYYGYGVQILEDYIWLYEFKTSPNQTKIHWYEFIHYHLPNKMNINIETNDISKIISVLNEQYKKDLKKE